jgi:acetyl esterase/lipase
LTQPAKFVWLSATIKTHPRISTLRHTQQLGWSGALVSLALIFSGAFCSAQVCPDDIEPPTPPQQALDPAFQPHIYDPDDNTTLRRLRFTPDPAIWGPGPYPTVLTIHGGEFKEEDDHGTIQQGFADYDLSQAGFLVFSIEHRLAPNGLLMGQHKHDDTPLGVASGRPPQQSNDVKQQILAALADSQCNQTIFLVGGSSGGTHALWAALDPAPTVPGWDSTTLAKIKAVVGLSGVYDLSLRRPQPSQAFINDVDNYTHTTENEGDCVARQYLASPISLVAAAMNIPPVRLYATEMNSVPPQQAVNMKAALLARDPNADVMKYTMSGSEHAFNYWHMVNNLTGECVSTEVIAFLNAHR